MCAKKFPRTFSFSSEDPPKKIWWRRMNYCYNCNIFFFERMYRKKCSTITFLFVWKNEQFYLKAVNTWWSEDPSKKKSHSYNLSQRKRALISVIFLWSVHKWSTYIFQVNHLDHDVHIGNTGKDEMCNFYMMYWVKGKEPLGTLHFHFSILSFIIENPCIKVQNAIFFSF